MKKTLKLLYIGLIISLTSCSSPPVPPFRIVIQATWPSYGAVYLAQEKGIFAKHGVQVTLSHEPGYVQSLNPYKEGKADATFTMLADTILLNAEGVPSRFVYAVDYSDTGDMIIAHPQIKSLEDLKGKKVSIDGFYTFSHLMVLKLLKNHGISEGEFEMVNIIEPSKVLAALEAGEIQAGHMYGLSINKAFEKGYKMVGKAGDVHHLMIEGLTVNTEVIKTRPQQVQGVVSALAEAMNFLRQHPDEGLEIIARNVGLSKPELETTFRRIHVLTPAENPQLFTADSHLFKGGREIIDFFYQKGMLVKIPDLQECIDGQFSLEAAKVH